MKIKIQIYLIALLLLFVIACDPSYRMEYPELNEKKYNSLPFEEKLEVFKKVSGHIDTPDYVDRGMAKEGEKAIPSILEFIEKSRGVKKIDAIYLFSEMHKNYFNLKNTNVEEFLKKKLIEEKDKNYLDSYKSVLETIRSEQTRTIKETKEVMLTPGSGNVPPFYSGDEDITQYVALIKEKIIRETQINQKELEERFSVVGYAKGEKISSWVTPIDEKTVRINFVAKADWIEIRDSFRFNFLDEQGKKFSLDRIDEQIKVPFYFGINKLKSLNEVEKIVAKKDSRLKINIPPLEAPYYDTHNRIRLYYSDKIIALEVFGTVDESKNQCVAGRVNLLNGDMITEDVDCLIY